jgi:hypothetical protein
MHKKQVVINSSALVVEQPLCLCACDPREYLDVIVWGRMAYQECSLFIEAYVVLLLCNC